MKGNVLGQTAGKRINGIIDEYVVANGGNVKAGDFVKYINGTTITAGNDEQLSNQYYAAYAISAVELSENKVFIVHSRTNYTLYATICTISENNITVSEDVELSTGEKTVRVIRAVKLSNNKVFIAHSRDGGAYYLYALICTIDENSITAGTDTQLSPASSIAEYIEVAALSENKVIIAHNDGNTSSSYDLNAIVCTINGNSIAAGTDTRIKKAARSGQTMSVLALSNNRALINYNNNGIYAALCEINGSEITILSTTQVSSIHSSEKIAAVKLSENKVFITNAVRAIVCKINENSITTGEETLLNSSIISSEETKVVALSKNKVMIIYSGGSSSHLSTMICTIKNTNVTAGTETQLSTSTNSGCAVSAVLIANRVLIVHSRENDYYLYATIAEIEKDTVKQLDDVEEDLFGIAKTSGQAESTIKVYTPNV